MTYETDETDKYGDHEQHGLFLPVIDAYSVYGFSNRKIVLHYPNGPKPSHDIEWKGFGGVFYEIEHMGKVLQSFPTERVFLILHIFLLG
jgi:hypothetical protein